MRPAGPASTRPTTAGSTPRPRRSATRLPRILGATDSSRPPEVWLPVFLEPENPLLAVPLRRRRPVPPGSLFGEGCLMQVTLLRERHPTDGYQRSGVRPAVPLACHSHRTRTVPSGQPRTTPQRPPPAPFAPSPASAPARSGFASRWSGWSRLASALPCTGRPIDPWSRRTGAPEASATGWDRSPPVHGGYTRSRQVGDCNGHERSPRELRNRRSDRQEGGNHHPSSRELGDRPHQAARHRAVHGGAAGMSSWRPCWSSWGSSP
jgi:hypothetical protein